ncbi:hypothetical protein CBL_00789 [Carabus blaptoides fortunei]
MLEPNVYHTTRSIYLAKLVHLLLCVTLVILCICEISLVYIIVNNSLQSYGSVYYGYTRIIEKALISTSSVGVILGICGLLFSFRYNYILVILYGPLTFLLCLIEICLCIIQTYYVYNNVIDNYMAKELKNHFILSNNMNESRIIIDYIQEKMECCGIYGPVYYVGTNISMPVSCCPEQNCEISMYYEGCLSKLLSTPIYSLIVIYIIQAIIFCLQIFSMIASIIFAKNFIDQKNFSDQNFSVFNLLEENCT